MNGAKFFKENNYLIGISIDDPCELHDAYRVKKGGEGIIQTKLVWSFLDCDHL